MKDPHKTKSLKNFRCSPLDSAYFTLETLLCSLLGMFLVWLYAMVVNSSGPVKIDIHNLGYQRYRVYVPIISYIARNLLLYFIFIKRKASDHYASDSGRFRWLIYGLMYIVPGEIIRFLIYANPEFSIFFGSEVVQTSYLLFFSGENFVLLYIPYFVINIAVLMFMYRAGWNSEKKKRIKMKNTTESAETD